MRNVARKVCDLCGRIDDYHTTARRVHSQEQCHHYVCLECSADYSRKECPKCMVDSLPKIETATIRIQRRLPRIRQFIRAAQEGVRIATEQLGSTDYDQERVKEALAWHQGVLNDCTAEEAKLLALFEWTEQEKVRIAQEEKDRIERQASETNEADFL